MKRLLPLLISVTLLGLLLYFLLAFEIMPVVESLEAYDYIIYALVVLVPISVGVTLVLFLYRKKDKKIRAICSRGFFLQFNCKSCF